MIGRIPNALAYFILELKGPVPNRKLALDSVFDDVNLFVELTEDNSIVFIIFIEITPTVLF